MTFILQLKGEFKDFNMQIGKYYIALILGIMFYISFVSFICINTIAYK